MAIVFSSPVPSPSRPLFSLKIWQFLLFSQNTLNIKFLYILYQELGHFFILTLLRLRYLFLCFLASKVKKNKVRRSGIIHDFNNCLVWCTELCFIHCHSLCLFEMVFLFPSRSSAIVSGAPWGCRHSKVIFTAPFSPSELRFIHRKCHCAWQRSHQLLTTSLFLLSQAPGKPHKALVLQC